MRTFHEKARDLAPPLLLFDSIENHAVDVRKLLVQLLPSKRARTPGPLQDAIRLAKLCEKLAQKAKKADAVKAIEYERVIELVSLSLDNRLHQVFSLQKSSVG